ncbi:CsbD family protein [Thioclava sp. GXIMD4215]|uniref:CsbD family protein n=1 Tax=Thioclava sp. GXIMD4215 TaxID=3131928 RepID=UPI00324629D2
MNTDMIEGKWKELTGSVKAQWGKLTDDEIAEANGNREKLEGMIQQKYGKTKDEAKHEVNRFFDKL